MTIFLTITPADIFSSDQIMAVQRDELALLSLTQWWVVLLEQDEDAFTFGAPAHLISDLGTVPVDCRTTGDPEWGALHSRIEVAGYDAGEDTFYNELVPGGLWMRCEYRSPQVGVTITEMWDGNLIGSDDDGAADRL
jgi:hypothetical protein